MATILSIFLPKAILFLVYFFAFTKADQNCIFCPFEPNVIQHLTPNGTLNPRGCYSLPTDKLHTMKNRLAKTCVWDIAIEPFEVFFDASTEMNQKMPIVYRLVPPGLVSILRFDNKNTPNTCERLEIPYANVENLAKVKIMRCYCKPELCNKYYPLCKWFRAADPSLAEPYGCVEDDKFPSDKEPRLYTGPLYKRIEDEPVPGSVDITETKSTYISEIEGGGRTCGDEIDDIVNGIKEIQSLLKDEL